MECDSIKEPKNEDDFDGHPLFVSDPADIDTNHPIVGALQSLTYQSEDPNDNALAYKNEGNHFYKLKHFRKAITSYSAGLMENLSDNSLKAVLLTNRAICNLYLKNYSSCYKDCRTAIVNNPSYLKPYLKGIEAYVSVDKLDQASELLQQAFDQFPEDEELKKLKTRVDSKLQIATAAKSSSTSQSDKNLKLNMILQLKKRGICLDAQKPVLSIPDFQPVDAVYIDATGRLHWPVLLLYPEFGQTDILKDVSERSTIEDCLRVVFPDSDSAPGWDVDHHYHGSVKHLEAYYENSTDDEVMHRVDTSQSIRELTKMKNFSVGKDLVIVINVVSNLSTAFRKLWTAQYVQQ